MLSWLAFTSGTFLGWFFFVWGGGGNDTESTLLVLILNDGFLVITLFILLFFFPPLLPLLLCLFLSVCQHNRYPFTLESVCTISCVLVCGAVFSYKNEGKRLLVFDEYGPYPPLAKLPQNSN